MSEQAIQFDIEAQDRQNGLDAHWWDIRNVKARAKAKRNRDAVNNREEVLNKLNKDQ